MQNKSKFELLSNLFPYLIAILFLLLYFTLSINSRIAGDDYYYLWLKNNFGAWEGMLYQYNAWSGRWSAHFAGCTFISAWKNPIFLPTINTATLVFLFIAIRMNLKTIFKSLNFKYDQSISAYSILLICACFFLSYEIGETWFWYIIILTYLWSIIAFFILVNCIFSEKKSFFNYLFLILFSAYIGGASESYAIIFLGLLVFLLVYRLRMRQTLFSTINSKLFLAIVILLISFIFSALAPGTEIRHSLLPQTSFTDKTWISFKAYSKFFVRFLPEKFIYIFLFSSPWLIFGSNFLKNKYSNYEAKKIILKLTLVFLLILAAIYIPTAFIMSETGPGRALSIISFLSAIYFAIIFTLTGILTDFNKIVIRFFYSMVLIGSLCVLIYNLNNQYINSKIFSEECDERLKTIFAAKENNFKGVLELKIIPPAGMLYWDELSVDTSYYVNQHLKHGLDLSFSLKLSSR